MAAGAWEQTGVGDGLMLRVLGPTTLERDGQSVGIGGPRQRAVLARLALAEGHLVTVDRLVDDIWGPDASLSIQSTLHSYVSRLRGALGDPGRLRRDGPGYVLDLLPHQFDSVVYERNVLRAQERAATDPLGALEQLDQAAAWWRGPALADVFDAAWASAAAVRLDEIRITALACRFDALLALGRHAASVGELERAVDEHPLQERFAAQLMLALYRSGRQADALRSFERTRRHLLDELGLDPSPELVRLESAILGHEPWLELPASPIAVPDAVGVGRALPVSGRSADPPAVADVTADDGGDASIAAEPRPPRSPVALPPAAVRHLDRPFVGRAAELATLTQAWHAALAGRRRLVVVEGEAGAGKSRLSAYFAGRVHLEGAVVMWGRATPEAVVPYEPLVEALRTVLRTVSPEARSRVVTGRDGLLTLMPYVDDLAPDLDIARPEVGTDRYVLFETVAELLDAESAAWPVVFVLDDLQWADPLSLRLLRHLLQHERPGRLLMVGTVRSSPVTPNSALDAFLADLGRDGLVDRVSLEGLAEEEVGELLERSGFGAAPARAAAIHRATRGNPFFVTELAEQDDQDTNALPASVRDAITARLVHLDAGVTRVVSVAAVAGPSVTLDVLAGACGVDRAVVLDAIDVLLDAGVVTEEPGGAVITFRHALVQQVVLDRLSRSRRLAIHLTLADAIEALGASRLEVAHHLVSAGPLAPPPRTAAAGVAAGREALGVLAYEDGEQWARRVLDLAVIDERFRCEALLLRSDAQRALGDRLGARAAAAEAAQAARQVGDPVLLARAAEAVALARAGLGFDFGTTDPGLEQLLAEALRGLPADEVDHRARLLGASLSNAAAEGNVLALRGLSDEALGLASANGQSSLVATAHLAARMSGWRVELLAQRLATDDAAWRAGVESGNLHLQLNVLLYYVADLVEAGRLAEAEERLELLRRGAADVRQPVYDAFVGFFDATFALLHGEYDSSAKLADDSLLRGLQSHGANAEHAWAGQTFIRAWDRGELGGLVAFAEQAAARPPVLPIWDVALGACLVASGRGEEARPILERYVTDDGIGHNPDSLWFSIGGLLVEMARELGDRDRAAILRRELEPFLGRFAISGLGRACLGPVTRFVGVAAAVCGDLDAADALLDRAAEESRAARAVPSEARSLHDRAEVLVRRGRPEDLELAASLRERADELAQGIGLLLGGLGASVR